MNRIKQALGRFMMGRYGTDKLNMWILGVGVVVCLISVFIQFPGQYQFGVEIDIYCAVGIVDYSGRQTVIMVKDNVFRNVDYHIHNREVECPVGGEIVVITGIYESKGVIAQIKPVELGNV